MTDAQTHLVLEVLLASFDLLFLLASLFDGLVDLFPSGFLLLVKLGMLGAQLDQSLVDFVDRFSVAFDVLLNVKQLPDEVVRQRVFL